MTELVENEKWADILGFEGIYKISDQSVIKSYPREWVSGNGIKKRHNGLILKTRLNGRGYLQATLFKNGKSITRGVHRLVWEAFNGPTDLEIDHIKEGNKLDNRLVNLQTKTSRENSIKYRLTTNKTSQFTGVCWCKRERKWRAYIVVKKKNIGLGYFEKEEDARDAYLNFKKSLNE